MENDLIKSLKKLLGLMLGLSFLIVIMIGALVLVNINPDFIHKSKDTGSTDLAEVNVQEGDLVKDGIHMSTGLVAEEGYETVIANCTNCHAADLIIQNRGSKERWMALIDWMQETQGLWDLGSNEEIIVSYLSEYYAPIQRGRRPNLVDIEWYELKE
ncbi:hypothetical protein IFO69_16210 [Echinicola sp. CAU 1574]|uniref:Monoheme cytochrome C n=1 Tax=Echinicola arenosa TaxID=2774144 RepID=A0ABR9AND8_9BACT|nr:hypothetical protein [Echinicola arenosa]MBD8490297.1 hypothetical protein [Echinicola arenosa]